MLPRIAPSTSAPTSGTRPTPAPAPARLRRALALSLGSVAILSLALAVVAAGQLNTLEHENAPALADAQHLDTTVTAMSLVLRRTDLDRADSLAADFHAVAGRYRGSEANRNDMKGYDTAFADYYVSARRAATGTSMSDDADLTSAESATLASGVLNERLHDGIARTSLAVERTPATALRIRIVAALLIALIAAVALLLLVPHRKLRAQREAMLPEKRTDVATPREREDERGHLQEAVRRMAERRQAVAAAAAQVAERNRQQVELLKKMEKALPESPALKVIRGEKLKEGRTPVNASYALGKRAFAGV